MLIFNTYKGLHKNQNIYIYITRSQRSIIKKPTYKEGFNFMSICPNSCDRFIRSFFFLIHIECYFGYADEDVQKHLFI